MQSGQPKRTFGQWWDHDDEFVTVSIERVREIGTTALMRAGAAAADAEYLIDLNLGKALQGDHSRGIDKFIPIVDAALRGEIDLNPDIRVVRESAATALLDGGTTAVKGLACRDGMALAVKKAQAVGVGCVSVRSTSHSLTPMMQHAVSSGMVGLAMCQTPALVAPLGGKQALLGNAPFAVGIPATRHAPVIIDMSLTESSATGLFLAATQGQPAPSGAYLDPDGQPTTDVAAHLRSVGRSDGKGFTGSLTPIGGGHKGYALVLAVGLLCTLLADADPAWNMKSVLDRNFGSVFVAIDVSRFVDSARATQIVDDFLTVVKESPRRDGVDEILYPGERSQALRRERLAAGSVDLPIKHLAALLKLAERLEIPTDGLAELDASS